jgi:hypothetical protein
MRRIHAPEIEDEPWCPPVIRDGLTGFLQVAAETVRLYDAVAPLVSALVVRHRAPRLIDLCSGGGGPVVRLVERLHAEHGVDVDVVLTDLYPNHGAFDVAEARGHGRIRAVREAVDATDVPVELRGVRTMFNALHHFRPPLARKIVADAARKRQPLCCVEVVERRPRTVGFLMGVPVATLALAPLQRPFSATRAALTWALPVIPAAVWWDGMMSCLRSYSPTELAELTAGLDDDGYAFRVERIEVPWLPLRLTVLVGEPRVADAECG